MKTPKLDLTETEKILLKNAGIRINEIGNYSADELAVVLSVTLQRARCILALVEFQTVPSVGPKFALDLVNAGYYSIAELKDKNAAQLADEYEQQIGAWADPCLEDQFRLVVYYANNPGSKKQWWHFTCERKAYREAIGYPDNRPRKAWYELPKYV
jgi:hypothetical protein